MKVKEDTILAVHSRVCSLEVSFRNSPKSISVRTVPHFPSLSLSLSLSLSHSTHTNYVMMCTVVRAMQGSMMSVCQSLQRVYSPFLRVPRPIRQQHNSCRPGTTPKRPRTSLFFRRVKSDATLEIPEREMPRLFHREKNKISSENDDG